MNSLKLARYLVRRYVPIIGTTTGLRIVNMVTELSKFRVLTRNTENELLSKLKNTKIKELFFTTTFRIKQSY